MISENSLNNVSITLENKQEQAENETKLSNSDRKPQLPFLDSGNYRMSIPFIIFPFNFATHLAKLNYFPQY